MTIYKHIAKKKLYHSGYSIFVGDIYYTNEFGLLHRNNGPALIRSGAYQPWEIWFKEGVIHRISGPAYIESDIKNWYLNGDQITDESSPEDKWKLIKGNLENIFAFRNPSFEVQEYVIIHRPDLINQIPNLDPKLKEKYSYEMNLSGIDI